MVFLDKSVNCSSFAALASLKRVFGTKRVGHTGTLDPFASGLMIALVGGATRCAQLFSELDKQYEAVFSFGTETVTDDLMGDVTRSSPPPSFDRIQRALQRFRGEIEQRPPAYSAIHIDGVRAHKLAREGREVDVPTRRITVHELSVRAITDTEIAVLIHCSSGTYVRSIARDLGRETGSAAHVRSLRRTAVGPFAVEEAVSQQTVALSDLHAVLPALERLGSLARYELSDEELALVRNGGRLTTPDSGVPEAPTLLTQNGSLFAIGEWRELQFQYRMVYPEGIA